MTELSLNILDIAQNSISAEACLITVDIKYTHGSGRRLRIEICDNGKGMSPETAQRVADPFYTTRTTRKVGLGTSLFKMAAELADGEFSVQSKLGEGTVVVVDFDPDHIDAVPMGDIALTFATLVQGAPDIDFVLTMSVEDNSCKSFCADTREFRQVLEGVPLNEPAVLGFIREYISEHIADIFPNGYKL